MLEFRFGKTVVEVHFLFLSLITLCLLADEKGMALYGLAAGILHEMGHLTAFWMSGYTPRRLSFEICGIRIEQRTYEMSAAKEAFVLFAGSGLNFLCFGLSTLICGGFDKTGAFAVSHLVLGVLNLIPVRAFDGGKLLQLFLEQFCSISAADGIGRIIQTVVSVLITTICIYCFLEKRLNITAVILCSYIWIAGAVDR